MALAAWIIRKLVKLIAYLVSGVLGLVLVILVAINFLLQSESFTGFVLDQVLPSVNESLCAKIEVKSLELRLVPFRLELKGARFTDPEEKFPYPFAKLDRLFLTVKTGPLLRGNVVVSELTLEGVESYTRLDDGLANLPLCPSEPKPEEPEEEDSGEPFKLALPIVVEKLHLDGAYRFDMAATTPEPTTENPKPEPGGAINVTVGRMALDGKVDFREGAGDAEIEFRVNDASFLIGEMYERIDEIAIDATANVQTWVARVPRLSITAENLALLATAEATDLLGELTLAAELALDVDLAKVNQLVLTKPEDMQLRGPVTLKTTAGLKLGTDKLTYTADGTLTMGEGYVNDLALRNLNAVFAADQDGAKVKALHLETAGGRLDAQATVGLGGAMPLSSNLKIAGLDVGRALQDFGLKDLPVKAILDTHLTAGGKLSPLAIDAKGQIDVADVAYGDVVAVKHVNVNLDATTFGAENNVRELRVTADQLTAGGGAIPQATVLLQGKVGPNNNVIDTLQIKTAHTSVLVTGTANPQGALDLDALVQLGDLSEFESFVGGKKLAGQGKLSAKIDGTAKKPNVVGSLKIDNIVFDKTKIHAVSADLALKDQRATVDGLCIEAGEAVIKLDAAYDMNEKQPRLMAKLDMPETQIAELLRIAGQSDLDIKGVLAMNVDVEGPLDNLDGTVVVDGTKIEGFGEKIEKLTLNTTLADGLVNIKQLAILKKRGFRPIYSGGVWRTRPDDEVTDDDKKPAEIMLSGQVNPFEKTFNIKLRTEHLTEAASDTVIREKIHAMADIDLSADLKGTFENPGGELVFKITGGRYENFDLGLSQLAVKIVDQQVLVEGELLAGRHDVDLNSPPPAETAEADQQARDEQGLDELIQVAMGGSEMSGLLAFTDDDDQDDPDFGAGVETPTPGAPTAIKPQRDLGSIKIRATLGLGEGMPLDARVEFAEFDYSNFLKSRELVKQKVKGGGKKSISRLDDKNKREKIFGGRIRGAIVATGLLAAPTGQIGEDGKPTTKADVAVDALFDEILFQQNRFILRNQNQRGEIVPLHITVQDGQLAVPSFALGGEGVDITLTSTPLRGEDFLVLDGKVDLSIVSNFAEVVAEASGDLNLRAEIPVAFDLDKVYAKVAMPGSNFVIQNVPTAIENFQLDVEFANRTATIRQLTADIGGGKLTGGGTYKLPPAEPKGGRPAGAAAPAPEMDLFVKLKNVRTAFDPYLELSLNKVDLIITNRADGKLDISGEVEIGKAFATYEIDLITLLRTLQKPQGSVAGKETYEKKEESVFLNIGIRADRNVVFENNLARLEMSLDLLLTGSNLDTGMIGTVEIIKGHAQVWNNDYRITTATVQFIDETRIVPAMDINAMTEVRGGAVIVYVNVAGTPDNLSVSLSSDPPKPYRDIVALLTVGVSYDEFQTEGSGIGKEQALALAAQSLLGNRVSSYTGLDIGIDTSRGTPQVKASKELEKDLTLSVFQGIADETLGSEVEYDFIRYMAVYGEWSNFAGYDSPPVSGGFGAGIRLKIEFR
jgi:autotransporter translocation and assembly factor TamB